MFSARIFSLPWNIAARERDLPRYETLSSGRRERLCQNLLYVSSWWLRLHPTAIESGLYYNFSYARWLHSCSSCSCSSLLLLPLLLSVHYDLLHTSCGSSLHTKNLHARYREQALDLLGFLGGVIFELTLGISDGMSWWKSIWHWSG